MSEQKKESVEDIIAMLYRFAKGEELPSDSFPSFTSLACRIESAWKRDIEQLKNGCVLKMNKGTLEKLAERLKFHKEVAESGYALDGHASEDLGKAHLIVSELAKMKSLTVDDCPWWSDGGDCAGCPSRLENKHMCPFGNEIDKGGAK